MKVLEGGQSWNCSKISRSLEHSVWEVIYGFGVQDVARVTIVQASTDFSKNIGYCHKIYSVGKCDVTHIMIMSVLGRIKQQCGSITIKYGSFALF